MTTSIEASNDDDDNGDGGNDDTEVASSENEMEIAQDDFGTLNELYMKRAVRVTRQREVVRQPKTSTPLSKDTATGVKRKRRQRQRIVLGPISDNEEKREEMPQIPQQEMTLPIRKGPSPNLKKRVSFISDRRSP